MSELSSMRVMVVDDTETNIDILVETLGGTYDVSVAMDGEGALEAVADEVSDRWEAGVSASDSRPQRCHVRTERASEPARGRARGDRGSSYRPDTERWPCTECGLATVTRFDTEVT